MLSGDHFSAPHGEKEAANRPLFEYILYNVVQCYMYCVLLSGLKLSHLESQGSCLWVGISNPLTLLFCTRKNIIVRAFARFRV